MMQNVNQFAVNVKQQLATADQQEDNGIRQHNAHI
jgi:hypothetical protein